MSPELKDIERLLAVASPHTREAYAFLRTQGVLIDLTYRGKILLIAAMERIIYDLSAELY